MLVFVATRLLHLRHHLVQVFGVRTEATFEEADRHATYQAHGKRPPPSTDVLGQHVPKEVDAVVEQEEERPHECTRQTAQHQGE